MDKDENVGFIGEFPQPKKLMYLFILTEFIIYRTVKSLPPRKFEDCYFI